MLKCFSSELAMGNTCSLLKFQWENRVVHRGRKVQKTHTLADIEHFSLVSFVELNSYLLRLSYLNTAILHAKVHSNRFLASSDGLHTRFLSPQCLGLNSIQARKDSDL